MDLRKQKPSDRVTVAQQVNRQGMGPREDKMGKGGMLYNSPEFQNALTDVSTQFRDKINNRQGKGDRQNGPDSPMTSAIKAIMKNKNIFRKK